MFDEMTNCGRWSETVTMRFPETASRTEISEKIFSISVLELLVNLVGYVMSDKNISGERE